MTTEPWPPIVFHTVDCPTCGTIAGLACEDADGYRFGEWTLLDAADRITRLIHDHPEAVRGVTQ